MRSRIVKSGLLIDLCINVALLWAIRHLAFFSFIDVTIVRDRWGMFYFHRSSHTGPACSSCGCSIILIGRTARIIPRRAEPSRSLARLWERVEVVLTFWKMAAARALSSSMTSPRNRLLRTVAATHTRPRDLVRPPVRIFGAVRTRLYGLIHVAGWRKRAPILRRLFKALPTDRFFFIGI